MGRTYKRNTDLEDFDESTSFDDVDDDADLLDWLTRPNEIRSDLAGGRHRHPAGGRPASRALPDDWQDFDYGGDTFESSWR